MHLLCRNSLHKSAGLIYFNTIIKLPRVCKSQSKCLSYLSCHGYPVSVCGVRAEAEETVDDRVCSL